MAEAMIGEIRFFPYANYVPEGWFECDGRKLSIRQYTVLYATIGTAYGGDSSQDYFNIPNLQGTGTVNQGQGPGLSNYVLGHGVGTETVPLSSSLQLPAHSHTISLQNLGYAQEKAAFTAVPKDGVSYASRYWYDLTRNPPIPSYFSYNPVAATTPTTPVNPRPMAAQSLTPVMGQSQPHENRQPFLALRPAICWNGYFMPRP